MFSDSQNKSKMNACAAIQRQNVEALKACEHEILENVNEMYDSGDIEYENYLPFWIASSPDHKIGCEMYEVFVNTCRTALTAEKCELVMKDFSVPTMIGAICSENMEILELTKDYVDRSDIWEAIQVTDSEVIRSWYDRSCNIK